MEQPQAPVATAPVVPKKTEIQKYFELEPASGSTNILDWWAGKEEEFPCLSKMARQYLGCPATSASAERLFSIAGRMYDDLRHRLDPQLLEEMMWARINSGMRDFVLIE